MNKTCDICLRNFPTPYSFWRHTFKQHGTGCDQERDARHWASVAPEAPHNSPLTMDEISDNCNGQFNPEVRPEKSFAFRHPFAMLLARPKCCGKTTLMKNLLKRRGVKFRKKPLAKDVRGDVNKT